MDPNERLNLQRMVKANDVEETTDLIIFGLRSNQIIYWFLLLISLIMFLLQNKSDQLEDLNGT